MPPSTRSKTTREAVAATATGRVRTSTSCTDVDQDKDHPHRRQTAVSRDNLERTTHSSTTRNTTEEPPRFVIDLSCPAEERYDQVCAHFKEQMQGLTTLFDDVVVEITRYIPSRWLYLICRLFLRRVYDDEENAELQGISKATSVPMFLLVCFNVLLDLFMGCSSGGAAVKDRDTGSKMVHFRTLDWGMDPLRQIVVQLDFKTAPHGPIVASSITYAGYVGVLTGVRKDLSLSLNFRPNRHDRGRFWPDVLYGWHLFMVLLGRRRSISSQLRQFLLCGRRSSPQSRDSTKSDTELWQYSDIVQEASGQGEEPLTTTACYLCFSNGQETTVLEKDRVTAVVHRSDDFIVITNNDIDAEHEHAVDNEPKVESEFATALAEIVHEARDRRQCAEHNYHNMRVDKAKAAGIGAGDDLKRVLEVRDVVHMVQLYPTLNESSHYACVMDATDGKIAWCRRWMKPVSAQWIRAHQSATW